MTKLEKRIGKGESIQQAIKALTPKEPKKPKEPKTPGETPPGEGDNDTPGQNANGEQLSDSESFVSLTIGPDAAKALASLLDVPADLDPKALQAALSEAIKNMAPNTAEAAE